MASWSSCMRRPRPPRLPADGGCRHRVAHRDRCGDDGHVSAVLNRLGYTLEKSIAHDAPAHRFVRGKQQIDVMIADHLAPATIPTIGGRKPFQVAGGTQALQRTVNCRMTADDDGPVLISIPNALGALVLKGAAYREDSRDKDRHLDDAVVLCATIRTPLVTAAQMKGSDKSRVLPCTKNWPIRGTDRGSCWTRPTGHRRWTRCAYLPPITACPQPTASDPADNVEERLSNNHGQEIPAMVI